MKRILVVAAIVGFALILTGETARADPYDPNSAGHPLRILAYVAHPVGVTLDYILLRPAHWIVNQKGLSTFFGHKTLGEKYKVQRYDRPSRKKESLETIAPDKTDTD